MSLAEELDVRSNDLYTYRINYALHNHDVAEIAEFIKSSEDFVSIGLLCRPVNEEFGRRISDAIVQNAHIRALNFQTVPRGIRDLVAWIGSRNTLVNMTSLESVSVYATPDIYGVADMSLLDCSTLFPLLLTSRSLHSFTITFGHDTTDDVMSDLLSYIGSASIREFGFETVRLSEAAFTALCDGVALSTVRHFTLFRRRLPEFNLETAAESLVRMIVESSLEEVTIRGYCRTASQASAWSESFISALKLTAPVRNMDFAFTEIRDDQNMDVGFTMHGDSHKLRLRINRKWNPLVFSANTPLALWPHILEKSHASPETSHGSAGILFYLLRQRPDLMPAP